ncbi:polysaccharide biosynthesis/export family protein [Marivirga arenosa]|uniref:Polysaccharide biosynthesis/export family protein n=1 Tax=Marivirga arenosa TaxID=3059076 RepID=A0AA49GG17_9BACT|nr:polysaccharide biosynthesis/export family protein [Marivirga sp. BKB1-2]WKK80839.2 polysaccharide biosynthesis/export family protein [Marivirga sp. BKB1-2]
MLIRKFIYIGFIAISFFSCVSNKDIVYLQHPDDPEKGEVSESDSIIRTYQTYNRPYELQPEDIISLRIASLTPAEFDFVKQYEEQLGIIRKLNQYNQGTQDGGNQNNMRMQGMGAVGEEGSGLMPIMLDRQQTGFTIDRKGNLELPEIGEVQLAGLSIREAEELIKEKLINYFETPVVRIQLLSFHFTVLGEVNNEGRYTSFDPKTNVIDAITLAENLTDFADRSRLKVVRFSGSEAQVYYVNTLREDLVSQKGFYLQPNDLIVVPALRARQSRRYLLPATTNIIGVTASALSLILIILNQTQ